MPEMKKYNVTEPWLNLNCGLGEAPYWERDTNTVRFVDIVKKKLYFVNLDKGSDSLETHDLEYSIGTTADIEGTDKEIIFGGKLGYGIYNRETKEQRWIKKMWNDEERKEDNGGKPGVGKTREQRMRSNDGAVDVNGRYWVGAMNDPPDVDNNITDEGVLFRLDPDLTLHRMKTEVTIPNGMSWTLDNKSYYFTDSPTQTIGLYPFDQEMGKPAFDKGTTYFSTKSHPGTESGFPDGHCQDEEGCFWIACYGTGKVLRVDPEGKVIAEIEFPTRCVTCPALAGTTLIVTSAEEEDPKTYPDSAKYQGAVFKLDVGVRGCPLNKFKLEAKA